MCVQGWPKPFLSQTVHCSRVSRVLLIRQFRVLLDVACRVKDGQRGRLGDVPGHFQLTQCEAEVHSTRGRWRQELCQ